MGFFIFALGYPMLYVLEEATRIPAPVRALGEERVIATDRARVCTSARLVGRTPGGFSGFLREAGGE